jgi:polyisoprenoid-binding protein YceI
MRPLRPFPATDLNQLKPLWLSLTTHVRSSTFVKLNQSTQTNKLNLQIMKPILKRIGFFLPAFCLLQTLSLFSVAQVAYMGTNMQLTINGTSTLHDWNMKSSQANCQAVFVFNSAGQLTGLNSLVFTTQVKELKSGKSAMDNNAYKALKTEKNPTITYTMTSATVTPIDGGALIKTVGKLSIAGKVVSTDVVANCRINADKSIAVTGTKNISMLDFQVTPPTFMMGTIKTGSALVLNFNGLLKK